MINKPGFHEFQIIKYLLKQGNYLWTLIQIHQQYQIAMICQYQQELEQLVKMSQHKFSQSQLYSIIVPIENLQYKTNNRKFNVSIISKKPLSIKQLLIKNQPSIFNSLEILKIIGDLIQALQIMHIKGIYHGRISLETVYASVSDELSYNYVVNILDTHIIWKHEDQQVNKYKSQRQEKKLQLGEIDDLESLIYLVVDIISGNKLFINQKFTAKDQSSLRFKWKSCAFFQEMVKILPPQLCFIQDLYLSIKTMNKNHIPNYNTWIKMVQIAKKQILEKEFNQNNKYSLKCSEQIIQTVSIQIKQPKYNLTQQLNFQDYVLDVPETDNEENIKEEQCSEQFLISPHILVNYLKYVNQ